MASTSYLEIANKRVLVREGELSVIELKFYEDNPRVYSMMHSTSAERNRIPPQKQP